MRKGKEEQGGIGCEHRMGTGLGQRMKRVPHKHWHGRKWVTSLGGIFPQAFIYMSSYEGQRELGKRTHQLKDGAADWVPGLAGLPPEAHPIPVGHSPSSQVLIPAPGSDLEPLG